MSSAVSKQLYQFKITLAESDPPIWRRVQMKDCTLARLHEVIVLAMGWPHESFSFLVYEFRINGQRFGLTATEQFGSEDVEISELVPDDALPFAFIYECELDNRWVHEVEYEDRLPAKAGRRYPFCVDGERACPLDDFGGMSGYEQFLKVLANRDLLHEPEYAWLGADFDLVADFDPDHFDSRQATAAVRRRLSH